MTITHQQIAAARVLLICGTPLVEIAVQFGVRSHELDRALWSQLEVCTADLFAGRGRPIKYQPDFDVV